jgi:hypothetical protein
VSMLVAISARKLAVSNNRFIQVIMIFISVSSSKLLYGIC